MYRKIIQYTATPFDISKLILLLWRNGNVTDIKVFKIYRASSILRSVIRKRLRYHPSWITLYVIWKHIVLHISFENSVYLLEHWEVKMSVSCDSQSLLQSISLPRYEMQCQKRTTIYSISHYVDVLQCFNMQNTFALKFPWKFFTPIYWNCNPFIGDMKEQSLPEIEIHDIDATAVGLLLDYAYSGQITITPDNVQVLLPASSALQMQEVRDSCCQFLLKQLHPTNCLGIRRFAGGFWRTQDMNWMRIYYIK